MHAQCSFIKTQTILQKACYCDYGLVMQAIYLLLNSRFLVGNLIHQGLDSRRGRASNKSQGLASARQHEEGANEVTNAFYTCSIAAIVCHSRILKARAPHFGRLDVLLTTPTPHLDHAPTMQRCKRRGVPRIPEICG